MQQICTWSVFADRDDVDEGDDYYFQLCPLNIVKDTGCLRKKRSLRIFTPLGASGDNSVGQGCWGDVG